MGVRNGNFNSLLSGVSSSGNRARNAVPRTLGNLEFADCGSFRKEGCYFRSGLRSLYGKHRTSGSGVHSPDRGDDIVGIRRVRHDIENLIGNPPHNDVIKN